MLVNIYAWFEKTISKLFKGYETVFKLRLVKKPLSVQYAQ